MTAALVQSRLHTHLKPVSQRSYLSPFVVQALALAAPAPHVKRVEREINVAKVSFMVALASVVAWKAIASTQPKKNDSPLFNQKATQAGGNFLADVNSLIERSTETRPQARKELQLEVATAREEAINEANEKDVFWRLFNVFERIRNINQIDAHLLTDKMEKTTKSCERLTALIQRIRALPKGSGTRDCSDWKELIDEARRLGVPMNPKEGYVFLERDLEALATNATATKDGLDATNKKDQLTMQRLLQQISECDTFRSNLLKMVGRIMETIIHNIKP